MSSFQCQHKSSWSPLSPNWGRSLFVIVILFKWLLEGNFFSVLFIYFGFVKFVYFIQHFYIFYLTFCWKLEIWIMNKRMKKLYHQNDKRTWAKFNVCICKNTLAKKSRCFFFCLTVWLWYFLRNFAIIVLLWYFIKKIL